MNGSHVVDLMLNFPVLWDGCVKSTRNLNFHHGKSYIWQLLILISQVYECPVTLCMKATFKLDYEGMHSDLKRFMHTHKHMLSGAYET